MIDGEAAVSPAGSISAAAVAAIWSELLDGRPVAAEDDFFFDVDGNSLLAVAIVAEMANRTGLPLELRDLYLAPTPSELSVHLAELAERLASFRSRMATWQVPVFAEALAELGAAAAASLLPETAAVAYARAGAAPATGAARVAVLRQARGDGPCTVLGGDRSQLRCHDRTVRIDVEPGAAGLVVRFTDGDA